MKCPILQLKNVLQFDKNFLNKKKTRVQKIKQVTDLLQQNNEIMNDAAQ